MNIEQANYESLLDTYYQRTAAPRGEEYLLDQINVQSGQELRTMLRNHNTDGDVDDQREIQIRAAVDRLLTCYSMLELASMSGFIPSLADTAIAKHARVILNDTWVRAYFERHYPLFLPQLFHRRVNGATTAAARSDTQQQWLQTLLALDRDFVERLEDGKLLRMFDSFFYDGKGFVDVLHVIEDPQQFIDLLLLDPETANDQPLSEAVNQLGPFIQFCVELNALLKEAADDPLMQSALWAYYGYWFDILGRKLNAGFGKALHTFSQWSPPASDADKAASQIQHFIHEGQSAIDALTSRKYGEPMFEMLKIPH